VKITIALFMLLNLAYPAYSQQGDGVLMRCGASSGHGYFFYDELTNPSGPNWADDGISQGKIILIRLGEEWDIQFDDAVGAFGYRQDGAVVLPMLEKPGMLTVAAIGQNYVDIYTFDFIGKTVAWSSNKIGPIVAKVSAYSADCN
jgi:hypothetical protein